MVRRIHGRHGRLQSPPLNLSDQMEVLWGEDIVTSKSLVDATSTDPGIDHSPSL